jgi:hypothetical protein
MAPLTLSILALAIFAGTFGSLGALGFVQHSECEKGHISDGEVCLDPSLVEIDYDEAHARYEALQLQHLRERAEATRAKIREAESKRRADAIKVPTEAEFLAARAADGTAAEWERRMSAKRPGEVYYKNTKTRVRAVVRSAAHDATKTVTAADPSVVLQERKGRRKFYREKYSKMKSGEPTPVTDAMKVRLSDRLAVPPGLIDADMGELVHSQDQRLALERMKRLTEAGHWKGKRVAYATLDAEPRKGTYWQGVVAWAQSLRDVGWAPKQPSGPFGLNIDVVVMVPQPAMRQVTSDMRVAYQATGVTLRAIEPFCIPSYYTGHSAWYLPWHKISVWGLEEYDVVVYMDADSLMLRNADELFGMLESEPGFGDSGLGEDGESPDGSVERNDGVSRTIGTGAGRVVEMGKDESVEVGKPMEWAATGFACAGCGKVPSDVVDLEGGHISRFTSGLMVLARRSRAPCSPLQFFSPSQCQCVLLFLPC